MGTSGVVTGITAGTDTISYSITSVCGTSVSTAIVTVNPLPTAGVVMGAFSVCALSSITLSDPIAGGTWSSSYLGIAITGSDGTITGVSAGIDTISYAVTNSCGTAVATQAITVNPLPDAGVITGPDTLCAIDTISVAESVSGGIWNTSNLDAFVSGGGIVVGFFVGTDTVMYSVTNGCGTASTAKTIEIINCTTGIQNTAQQDQHVTLFPNPAQNNITISSAVPVETVSIHNLLGQQMFSRRFDLNSVRIDISGFSPGIYFVSVNGMTAGKFVKE